MKAGCNNLALLVKNQQNKNQNQNQLQNSKL